MPDHRLDDLTGQRADGDMAQPKSVTLWLSCVSPGAQGRQQRREHLWPVVLPQCNEWVPGQCDPNSTSPPRPGSTALVPVPLPSPPCHFTALWPAWTPVSLAPVPQEPGFVTCTCNAQGQTALVGHNSLSSSPGSAQQQHCPCGRGHSGQAPA